MEHYIFFNKNSGVAFGNAEGIDVLDAYRSLLVAAGYYPWKESHQKLYSEFLGDDSQVDFKKVDLKYLVSIDNVGVYDTISIFDGFEYDEIAHARQAIADLKSDPQNEYTYRLYKGGVTRWDSNDAPEKAYVLEIL